MNITLKTTLFISVVLGIIYSVAKENITTLFVVYSIVSMLFILFYKIKEESK